MAEANDGHAIANGEPRFNDARPGMAERPVNRPVNLQRIRDKAQNLREDLLEQLNHRLDDLFDSFINEVEQIEQDQQPDSGVVRSQAQGTKRKNGELPDKVFINRRSVLTELLESSHIQTIYHIFVAILIVFSLNTLVYDWVEKGTLNLNFDLIFFAFGKTPKVMAMWVCMQLGTLVVVYPAFYYWATHRTPGKPGQLRFYNTDLYDWVWLGMAVTYQVAFLVVPVTYLVENDMPPASSVIITCEQLRLMMKAHAFIRENACRVVTAKKNDDDESGGCPDFSKYLYFLFAPTLVYRDSYPRTKTIRWRYVVSNFAQVLACLFYTYYIFERFCVPVFQNFNREHVTAKALMLSVFGSMMPATLVLFIGNALLNDV